MFEFNEDNIESEKNFKKIDLSTSPNIITESNVTYDNLQNDILAYRENKEKAFLFYKKHGNLNEFVYNTDNPDVRKKFEKWMKKFFHRVNNEKKFISKNSLYEDINGTKLLNIFRF